MKSIRPLFFIGILLFFAVTTSNAQLTFNTLPAEMPNVQCFESLPIQEILTATGGCDSTAAVAVISSIDQYVLDVCGGYAITYRWRATDVCGASIQITRTFNVLEHSTGPLILDVPPDLTIDLNTGEVVPITQILDALDLCSFEPLTATITDEINTPTSDGYSLYRRWEANDHCGNTSTVSHTITVIELVNTPTSIVFDVEPANISNINCSDELPTQETLTATGGCDSTATVIVVPTIDSYTVDICSGYPITYRWVATDACGASRQVIQTFYVLPNIVSPTILNVPPDLLVDFNTGDILPTMEILNAVDDCTGGQITTINNEVNILNSSGYSLIRTWTAIDDCGNVSEESQSIIVTELNATPIITFDAQPVEIADIRCDMELPIQETLTVTGGCDNTVSITVVGTIDPYTADLCGGYAITYRWRATDICGEYRETTRAFNVLADDAGPTFSNVPNSSMTVDLNTGDVIPLMEILDAVDGCSSEQVTITTDEITSPPGSGGYYVDRRWTASDQCGNTTTVSQRITVFELINSPTTITFDVEPVIIYDINCSDELPVQETLTAMGGCDSAAPVTVVPTIDPYSVNLCSGYPITYRWVATDVCGESIEITQNFNVLPDYEKPTILNVPSDMTVDLSAGDMVPPMEMLNVVDDCSGGQITSTTNEINVPTLYGYNLIRTWNATDQCDNESEEVQVITVIDSGTNPVGIVFTFIPDDYTISCEEPVEFQEPTATTDCTAGSLVLDYIDEIETYCGITSTTVRVWTATDDCGNMSTTSASITTIDEVAPEFDGAAELYVDLLAGEGLPELADMVNVIDNCSDSVALTYIKTEVLKMDGYDVVYDWTAMDDCGNVRLFSQTLYVTGGIIWPGDTDSNKVVNYTDIFNIGFGFGMTGDARDNPTLDFLPQYAEPWMSNGINNANFRHADTDGNGVVNLQDLSAVIQNYEMSHNLQSSEQGDTRESFTINFLYEEITNDNWVHVDIMLGDITETLYDFYGAGFIIEYDQSIVKAGSAHVDFSNSWGGTFFEDFVAIQKDNYDEGRIDVGITRINQEGIDGQGKIASFRFQLKDGIELPAFNLTARAGSGVYASKEPYNLETIETVITANRETVLPASLIRVFPNPTNELLNIVIPESIQPERIFLLNANSQLVRSTTEFNNAQIDVSDLGQGMYILQVVTEEGIWSERVTIMK